MRLIELIEHCHLDYTSLKPEVITQAITKNYSDFELDQLNQRFLRGIRNNLEMNSEITAKLIGIHQYFLDENELSYRQKSYLIHNIIQNWDQIDLVNRIEMDL